MTRSASLKKTQQVSIQSLYSSCSSCSLQSTRQETGGGAAAGGAAEGGVPGPEDDSLSTRSQRNVLCTDGEVMRRTGPRRSKGGRREGGGGAGGERDG